MLLVASALFVLSACARDSSQGQFNGSDVIEDSVADPEPGADTVCVEPCRDVTEPDPDTEPETEPVPDALPDTETVQPPAPVRLVTDKQFLVEVDNLVKTSKNTIDIAHFGMNDDNAVKQVMNTLVSASQFGRQVRVLLDDGAGDSEEGSLAEASAAAVKYLNDNGKAGHMQARLDSPQHTLHLKLVVVDGQRALFGSSNFSATSMFYSHEANLRVEDAALAARLQGFFDQLWADDSGLLNVSPLQVGATRLFFELDLYDQVRTAVKGAQSRVLGIFYDVSNQSDELNALINDLAQAEKRGCEVTFILEKADWETSVNYVNAAAAKAMQAKGLTVLADLPQDQTHAKMLIIDDQVFVLTANLSYESLFKDHEVGAATTEAQVLAEALAYFEALEAVSSPY
jgi:phosphatidylserine/phosphatidylglycerophosphate/cardiolipin synthase-like enzyme